VLVPRKLWRAGTLTAGLGRRHRAPVAAVMHGLVLALTFVSLLALVAAQDGSLDLQLNGTFGSPETLADDQARAAAQLQLGDTSDLGTLNSGLLVSNAALGGSVIAAATGSVFTVQASLGSTAYTLLLDTGSSNTWVGARSPYKTSSTTAATGQKLSVTYGSGPIQGVQLVDTVTLGSLVINEQQVGSTSTNVFSKFGVDGILGVGPVGLTVGKLSPSTAVSSPTVVDTMRAQGIISAAILSVYLVPSYQGAVSGQVSFGGIDPTRNTSAYVAVSKSTESPANKYWSCTVSMSAGGAVIASDTPAITDTGTTLVVIASDFFAAWQAAVTARVPSAFIDKNGMLAVPTASVSSVPSLSIIIDGHSFDLIGDACFLPESQSVQFGGTGGRRYSVVASSGRESGAGFDVTLGMTWLVRYATAYDSNTGLVSIASTSFTSLLFSQMAASTKPTVVSAQVAPAPPAQTIVKPTTQAANAVGFAPGTPTPVAGKDTAAAASNDAAGRLCAVGHWFAVFVAFALLA